LVDNRVLTTQQLLRTRYPRHKPIALDKETKDKAQWMCMEALLFFLVFVLFCIVFLFGA
jgi:hypothetical protein